MAQFLEKVLQRMSCSSVSQTSRKDGASLGSILAEVEAGIDFIGQDPQAVLAGKVADGHEDRPSGPSSPADWMAS